MCIGGVLFFVLDESNWFDLEDEVVFCDLEINLIEVELEVSRRIDCFI